MKTKIVFALLLVFAAIGLSACRNRYDVPVYYFTDSYSEVFEGKKVPQDVR